MRVYEEYESQQEKRRAQRGASRGIATGIARGYVLVFDEDGINTANGCYDGIGELHSGTEPGEKPHAMIHCTPHIDYLRDCCRFVGLESIPQEWKTAFARYLDNMWVRSPTSRKRYASILKHVKGGSMTQVSNMKNELVDIIYQALRRYEDVRINDVSLDGDHKSSEVIITLDDGEQKKDFVISNNDIRDS